MFFIDKIGALTPPPFVDGPGGPIDAFSNADQQHGNRYNPMRYQGQINQTNGIFTGNNSHLASQYMVNASST